MHDLGYFAAPNDADSDFTVSEWFAWFNPWWLIWLIGHGRVLWVLPFTAPAVARRSCISGSTETE
jgi:hypothetical protein